jgi:hypothetical protein
MIPSYWIGIFHPPNGAIRAFNAVCSKITGVLFKMSINFLDNVKNVLVNLNYLPLFVNNNSPLPAVDRSGSVKSFVEDLTEVMYAHHRSEAA